MQRLPRLAATFAFIVAALVATTAFTSSIVVLPMALPPLCAGIGILRGRVWSAWGFALYSGGQLLLIPLWLMRSGLSEAGATIAVAGAWSLGLAVLYLYTGRSLARSGATRGWAWPWIALTLATTTPFVFLHAYSMPTGSMENTLLVGDRILVKVFPVGAPQRGDLVTHVYPVDRKQTFVKRVVGIPGDRIHLVEKVLYVNGVAASEPWVVHKLDYIDAYRDNFPAEPADGLYKSAEDMLRNHVVNGEVVVPPGHYFVMGDNRDQSLDSRYWGFIAASDVIGKPFLVYDSADQGRTRWNRLFKLL